MAPLSSRFRPIRVLIADRHAMFRAGVRLLFESERDIEVSGEEGDAGRVAAALTASPSDVLLLDLELDESLPGLIESLAGLAKCVTLGGSDNPEPLSRSLDRGALGAVSKSAPSSALAQAVRAARRGLRWSDEAVAAYRRERGLETVDHPKRGGEVRSLGKLTGREREVAALVARGLRYRDVAEQLRISDHTVKNHLRRIFRKLQIRSRVELAIQERQRSA